MAYQVLARKYRPQRFADVAGQDHVTVTLMNALTQGRVAHGYIFSGHRGIGKTTIARILAMALNCRNAIGSPARPTPEPCEVCESCTEIRAGNAVDVIEIDAATNRGIDEIRELRDAARYRPARDRYKIYILDEAHQITDAAFNALLKTLEEPPDHIVFMMATTQPEDIPQTVRSRCQHFSFHAVKMADILHELRGIAEREGVEADDAALGLLAEAGDGSMRDALSVMDQAIASAPVEDGHAVLSGSQIRDLMGTVSNAVFERLLEGVDAGRSAEVMILANELMDAGNSPAQLARQAVRYLRNVLMAKIAGLPAEVGNGEDGGSADLLQISPEERRRAARSASLFSEEEITRFLSVLLRTFDELGYRQEPRLHFELGLLKLVHLRRLLPVEELLSGLPTGGSAPTATPRPAASAAARGPAAPQPLPPARPAAPPPSAPSEQARVAARGPAGQDPSRSVPPEAAPTVADTASRAPFPPPVPVTVAQPSPAPEPLASLPGPFSAPSSGVPERPSVRPRSSGEPGSPRSTPPPPTAPQSDSPAQTSNAGQVSTPPASSSEAPPQSEGDDPGTAAALQQLVVEALSAAKQTSAGDALEEAVWHIEGNALRVQTQLSKTMLGVVLNPEADRIARTAIRKAGAGALTVEWLVGARSATKTASAPRAARSGSAQAKAQEHPLVQQAQQLFNAEIRNVIDLSDGK